MEIRGVRDIQQICDDLFNRGRNVTDAIMDKDYLEFIEDFRKLSECSFWLQGISPAILGTEHHFYGAMYDAEDNMKDDNDSYEKFVFIMQKHFKLYLKEDLLPEIKDYIEYVRTLEFDDYRARDYQMDLARKLEMIRDYYKQRYNLD